MRSERAEAEDSAAEKGGSGRDRRNDSGTITRIAGDAGDTAGSRPAHGAERRQPFPLSPAGRQQQRDAHMAQVPAAGGVKAAASGAAVRSSSRTPATRRRMGASAFTGGYSTRDSLGCPVGAPGARFCLTNLPPGRTKVHEIHTS